MSNFSRYNIVLLIFMQVFASVLARENRSKDEKHFEQSDWTTESEKATNLENGLQKIGSEEPLGYLYINYEATKKPAEKTVYNTTQNITAFVEESVKPSSIVNGKTKGYVMSNESSFEKVEGSGLSHARLSKYMDRIPTTETRLLAISRQEPTADSKMMQLHKSETARIVPKILKIIQGKTLHSLQLPEKGTPKKEHVPNRSETRFQTAETQERNGERHGNGQKGLQRKQENELKKTERAKLRKWIDGLMKGEQRIGMEEDSRQNGREIFEKSMESERKKIEKTEKVAERRVDLDGTGRVDLDRTESGWRKSERNEIRNAESNRESALESIEKSRKGEWKNIEDGGSGESEGIGSEWNKGEITDISTGQRNTEMIEEGIGKSRMGKWRKIGGEGEMIVSQDELGRIESELGKGETNELRTGQSSGETTEERIEKSRMGEWRNIGKGRKAVKVIEEQGGIGGELSKDDKNEFRIGQSKGEKIVETIEKSRSKGEWRKMIDSTEQERIVGAVSKGESSKLKIGERNREKTAGKVRENNHRTEGEIRQYRTRYAGDHVVQRGRDLDKTEYGWIGMVNEGRHVLAGKKYEVQNGVKDGTKPERRGRMKGHDRTGQRRMEKMREGRRVLDVHGRIQGGILEREKAGIKGIDREKQGELWIEGSIEQLRQRLKKQEGISDHRINGVGIERSRMVLRDLNERMMGGQRRIHRVSEGELRMEETD